MLCCYRLQDSIRLFGDRFAGCLLKGVHRYDVGISTEAHSGDASLCERTYVCALADQDIDRQGRRLRQLCDQSQVGQPRDEQAIRTRPCIGFGPLKRFCNEGCVMFVLRYLDEDVGSCVYKERNVCRISLLASMSYPINLVLCFPEGTALRKAVFQVAADSTSLDGQSIVSPTFLGVSP